MYCSQTQFVMYVQIYYNTCIWVGNPKAQHFLKQKTVFSDEFLASLF